MKDRVRQAKAHEILVLSARIRAWLRYWRSLAWWQGLSHRCSFDPVGEIFQPYRHRAEPVLLPVRRQGWQRTTSRGEIGKREMGATVAIGGPGSRGGPSACSRDRYRQRCSLRRSKTGARSSLTGLTFARRRASVVSAGTARCVFRGGAVTFVQTPHGMRTSAPPYR